METAASQSEEPRCKHNMIESQCAACNPVGFGEDKSDDARIDKLLEKRREKLAAEEARKNLATQPYFGINEKAENEIKALCRKAGVNPKALLKRKGRPSLNVALLRKDIIRLLVRHPYKFSDRDISEIVGMKPKSVNNTKRQMMKKPAKKEAPPNPSENKRKTVAVTPTKVPSDDADFPEVGELYKQLPPGKICRIPDDTIIKPDCKVSVFFEHYKNGKIIHRALMDMADDQPRTPEAQMFVIVRDAITQHIKSEHIGAAIK